AGLLPQEPVRNGAAHIAHPTGFPFWCLAEVYADLPVTALAGFGEPPHCVIALPGALFLSRVRELVDEMRQQPDVALLPQQRTVGRLAVASGAARLLIILLDRLRHREMNYSSHRRLVDSQSEGDRPDQHGHF